MPTAASEPIIALPGSQKPSQTESKKEPLTYGDAAQHDESWCNLSKLPVQKGDKPPTKARIGSDLVSLQPYKNWTGFFVGFAKWLVASGKLDNVICPVFVHENSNLHLVSESPFHPSGGEFASKEEIGGGLWIDKNLDTPGKRRSLIHLFNKCGVDPSAVFVKTD